MSEDVSDTIHNLLVKGLGHHESGDVENARDWGASGFFETSGCG